MVNINHYTLKCLFDAIGRTCVIDAEQFEYNYLPTTHPSPVTLSKLQCELRRRRREALELADRARMVNLTVCGMIGPTLPSNDQEEIRKVVNVFRKENNQLKLRVNCTEKITAGLAYCDRYDIRWTPHMQAAIEGEPECNFRYDNAHEVRTYTREVGWYPDTNWVLPPAVLSSPSSFSEVEKWIYRVDEQKVLVKHLRLIDASKIPNLNAVQVWQNSSMPILDCIAAIKKENNLLYLRRARFGLLKEAKQYAVDNCMTLSTIEAMNVELLPEVKSERDFPDFYYDC